VSPAKSSATASAAVLPPEIFDAKVNVPLIHQVVVAQEAAARQGTHATKTRGDVRGGGKKPYRQKGTGRARQGSVRAPQYAGGGVVHGPQPRSYDQRTPKKMKAAALRGALSDRARHGRVHVVPALVDGDTPKTQVALTAVNLAIGAQSAAHVLVVIAATDKVSRLSLRNVASVHVLDEGQLNTRDVLVSDFVVFTQEALDSFVARATGNGAATAGNVAPAAPVSTAKPASAGSGKTKSAAPQDSAEAAPKADKKAAEPQDSAEAAPKADKKAAAPQDSAEPQDEAAEPKASKPRASRAKAKQEDDAQ
jgi:large subunit ribosomal protein L4